MLTETCWLSWYDLARGRTRDLPHESGTLSQPDVIPATRRCSPRLAGSPGMTWPGGEPATYHTRADTLTTKPTRCDPYHEAMLTETCWLSWYDLARGRTRDLPHESGTLSQPDVIPATRRCSPRLAGSPGMTWPGGEPATYHTRADTLTTKPTRCGPYHEAMLTETCWLSWFFLSVMMVVMVNVSSSMPSTLTSLMSLTLICDLGSNIFVK